MSPANLSSTPPRVRARPSPGASPLSARLSTASSTSNHRLTMIGALLARPYSSSSAEEELNSDSDLDPETESASHARSGPLAAQRTGEPIRTGRVSFAQPRTQAVHPPASSAAPRPRGPQYSTGSTGSGGSGYFQRSVAGSIHDAPTPDQDRPDVFRPDGRSERGGVEELFPPQKAGMEEQDEEISFMPSTPYTPGLPQTPRTPRTGTGTGTSIRTPPSAGSLNTHSVRPAKDVPHGKQLAASAYPAKSAHTTQTTQSMESGLVRPPTIIVFPEPYTREGETPPLTRGGEGKVIWSPPILAASEIRHQQSGPTYAYADTPGPVVVHAIQVEPAEYAPSAPEGQVLPPRSTSRRPAPDSTPRIGADRRRVPTHPAPTPAEIVHPVPTRTHTHPPPQMPHALPPPASPISPYLASPRAALAPARPESPTIRAFDSMKERRALFRGGEEELASPFQSSFSTSPSPSAGGGGGGGGKRAVPGRQGKTLRSMMSDITLGTGGQDFWRRMEMGHEARVGEKAGGMSGGGGGGEGQGSEWLEKQRRGRRRIRWAIWGSLGLVTVAVIALIVVFVVIKPGSAHSSTSSSTSDRSAGAAAAGAGMGVSANSGVGVPTAGRTTAAGLVTAGGMAVGAGGLDTAAFWSATPVSMVVATPTPKPAAVPVPVAVVGSADDGQGGAADPVVVSAVDSGSGEGASPADMATTTVDGLLL